MPNSITSLLIISLLAINSVAGAADAEFKLTPNCVDAAGLIVASPDLNVRAIKEMLGTGPKVVRDLLESPRHRPAYSEVLRMAHWIKTPEGQEVAARAAELINEHQVAAARKSVDEANAYFREIQNDVAAGTAPNVSLTKRESEQQGRQFKAAVAKLAEGNLADVPASEIFATAVKEVAAKHPERASEFELRWSEKLMGGYRLVPDAFVHLETIDHMLNMKESEFNSRKLPAVEHMFGYFGGRAEAEKFANRVDPILAPFFPPKKDRNSKIANTFYDTVRIFLKEEISHGYFQPSADLWAKVDAHIASLLDPIGARLKPADRKALEGAARAYIDGFYGDFIPVPYRKVTPEKLAESQIQTLAFYSQNLTRDMANEKDRAARAAGTKGQGKGDKGSTGKPLTRKQRMDVYQAQKLLEQDEAMRITLENATKPETASGAAKGTQPAVVKEDESRIVPEDKMEELIGMRTISSQRAENIMDFYDQLGTPQEKERFRKVLAQLLHKKRISDVVDGEVERLDVGTVYEVRIQGIRPIRLHFAISPTEGAMLLSAYYKKADDQQRRIDKDADAWAKY